MKNKTSKLSVLLVVMAMIMSIFTGMVSAATTSTTIELTDFDASVRFAYTATKGEVEYALGFLGIDYDDALVPDTTPVTVEGSLAFDAANSTVTFDGTAEGITTENIGHVENINKTMSVNGMEATFTAAGANYDASYADGVVTTNYEVVTGTETSFELSAYSFDTTIDGKAVVVSFADGVATITVDGADRHDIALADVTTGSVSSQEIAGTLNGEDVTAEASAALVDGKVMVTYLVTVEEEPTPTPTPTPTSTPAPTTPATPAPTATPAPESGVSQFIERLYNVALNRPSDPNGKADWINRVYTQGYTGADLTRGFLFSQEFLNKGLSNSDFIDALYNTIFDRSADTNGKAFWLDQLDNGASKEDVINGFIDSIEFANLCLTYGIESGSAANPTIVVEANGDILDFVTRLYNTCLDREPDQRGYADWTSQLANRKIGGTQCAYGFFFSPEFTAKDLTSEQYVTILYSVLLDRTPDTDGLAHWTTQLDNGASREDIFYGIAGSQEWGNLCISYGVVK